MGLLACPYSSILSPLLRFSTHCRPSSSVLSRAFPTHLPILLPMLFYSFGLTVPMLLPDPSGPARWSGAFYYPRGAGGFRSRLHIFLRISLVPAPPLTTCLSPHLSRGFMAMPPFQLLPYCHAILSDWFYGALAHPLPSPLPLVYSALPLLALSFTDATAFALHTPPSLRHWNAVCSTTLPAYWGRSLQSRSFLGWGYLR